MFLIAIGLEGQSVWKLGDTECKVGPQELVAFSSSADLKVRRDGARPFRFLLWHFNIENMRIVRGALGQSDSVDAATCRTKGWPMAGPFKMTADQQSLVLSLRCAPATPLRALWYGAKLLELFAILQPPAVLEKHQKSGYLHPAVQSALAALHANFASPPTLVAIASNAGISAPHLSRLFAQETGTTTSRYLRQLRMQRASQLLRTGECNVTEAALAVGYSSLGQFSRAFRETLGHSPGQHRRMH